MGPEPFVSSNGKPDGITNANADHSNMLNIEHIITAMLVGRG